MPETSQPFELVIRVMISPSHSAAEAFLQMGKELGVI